MSENVKPIPSGLGGWLLFAMVGLAISIVRANYSLYTTYVPIFSNGTWQALTTPGLDTYHPYWAPLLSLEIAGNIIVIGLAVLALILMLQKKRLAPRMAIACYATAFAFIAINHFAADLIPAVAEQDDSDGWRELLRSAVVASIWIPYFILSKRVKATFTK